VPVQVGKSWIFPSGGEKENKLERIQELEEKVRTLMASSELQHGDLIYVKNDVRDLKDTVDALHKTVTGLYNWSNTVNTGPASASTRAARGSSRKDARRGDT
jgi:hypothetical protein